VSDEHDDHDPEATRASKGLQGLPLLEWGTGPSDRCLVGGYPDLERLLRGWWSRPGDRSLRLWSRRDDLLLVAQHDGLCALQFLRSDGQYGTSAGDPARTDELEASDLDGTTRTLRGSDFVPLTEALPLILRFVADGDVPDTDAWNPMFSGPFFELSLQVGTGPVRVDAPSDPWSTSLAPLFGSRPAASVPPWAVVFVRICKEQELIALTSDADPHAVAASVAGVVEALAQSPLTPLQIAEHVADAMTDIAGIDEVFASAIQTSDALHQALSETAPPTP